MYNSKLMLSIILLTAIQVSTINSTDNSEIQTTSEISEQVSANTENVEQVAQTTTTEANGIVDNRENGTGEILYYLSDGTLEYREEYKTNILVKREDYTQDGSISKVTNYYSNGQISSFKTYKNKVITDYKSYFSNGKIKDNYNYYSNGAKSVLVTKDTNGKMVLSQKWYTNGKSSSLVNYKNGIKYKAFSYYSNGKLKTRQAYFSNGVLGTEYTYTSTGITTYYGKWTSSGNQTEKLTYYDNGKLHTDYDYYSNGKLKRYRSFYSNGKKGAYFLLSSSGKYTFREKYYSNGKIKEQYDFYSNKKIKRIKRYTTSGKYSFYREYYSTGKIKREYSSYFSNGKPKSRLLYTYYSNNVLKTKTQTDYDTKGNYSVITWKYNTKGVEQSEKMTRSTKSTYFKVPIDGYLTCQYACYDGHVGIDLGSTNKAIGVKATAPGIVVQVGGGCSAYGGSVGNSCNGGAGNYVVIMHTYKGQIYYSTYMHLSKINVKVNQKVDYKTIIGKMGNSGNSSATHLHFELYRDTDNDKVRTDEVRTNPAIYVDFSDIYIKY